MKAKRIDANQPEIAAIAQKLGISYQDLHDIGKGCGDALFGYAGVNIYAEIKDGKNDLNELQQKYHEEWKGQICTIRNFEDLLEEFNLQSYAVYGKLKPELITLLHKYFLMKINDLQK